MAREKASHMKRCMTGTSHNPYINPENYENPALVREEQRRAAVPVTYKRQGLEARKKAAAEMARLDFEAALIDWARAALTNERRLFN